MCRLTVLHFFKTITPRTLSKLTGISTYLLVYTTLFTFTFQTGASPQCRLLQTHHVNNLQGKVTNILGKIELLNNKGNAKSKFQLQNYCFVPLYSKCALFIQFLPPCPWTTAKPAYLLFVKVRNRIFYPNQVLAFTVQPKQNGSILLIRNSFSQTATLIHIC